MNHPNLIFLSNIVGPDCGKKLRNWGKEEFDAYIRWKYFPENVRKMFRYNFVTYDEVVEKSIKCIIFCDVQHIDISLNQLEEKYYDLLRGDNCKIIFFQSDIFPSDLDKNTERFQYIINFLNNKEISLDKVKMSFAEDMLRESYKVFDDFPFECNILNWTAILMYDDMRARKLDNLKPIYDVSKNYLRPYHYLAHCNNVKEHRIELLLFLNSKNLMDKGITSWFAGDETVDFTNQNPDFDWLGFDFVKEYENCEGILKYIRTSSDLKASDGPQDYLNPIPHFNSYLNIACETNWGPSGYEKNGKIWITEKVWKSMVSYQPFIIIGVRNSLKFLRENGFKTFQPFIDESYDSLPTYKERKKVFQKEIDRICNMPIELLDELYLKLENTLLHNHKHFFKFVEKQHMKFGKFINGVWSKF